VSNGTALDDEESEPTDSPDTLSFPGLDEDEEELEEDELEEEEEEGLEEKECDLGEEGGEKLETGKTAREEESFILLLSFSFLVVVVVLAFQTTRTKRGPCAVQL